MSGFARCTESKAQLCCLGEFLDDLRKLGWDRDDVRAVEQEVLELLSQSKEEALARRQDAA